MPRIAWLIVKEEEAVYHVMSRTALDGYVMGDVEKDFLLHLIKRLSRVYFTEVLGFCLMGNHFHLLVRMRPGGKYSDVQIKKRFSLYYDDNDKRELEEERLPALRKTKKKGTGKLCLSCWVGLEFCIRVGLFVSARFQLLIRQSCMDLAEVWEKDNARYLESEMLTNITKS